MPAIHEIANNIQNSATVTRITYLQDYEQFRNRNVICYYSNFLRATDAGTQINDADMHSFMGTVYKMDKSKGLDLFLHTPGGDPAATESIVTYLKDVFGNDIVAIIPHLAMSAGTMLACSCKEIIMGKHSSLGPIDPQYGGVPAFGIIKEFEKAYNELSEKPETGRYWQILLSKYPVALYEMCNNAVSLSDTLVSSWLEENMLRDNPDKVRSVLELLNENKNSKTHSRHFNKEKCRAAGLEIVDLEDNKEMQELVLSIHHCYMYLLDNNDIKKVVENHMGTCHFAN